MPRQKGTDTGGTDARLAILDAAERIFANEGYNGAVIRDIAEAAGVNLGLIQYHFGSKDKLFTAVINRRLDGWRARVAGSIAAATARPDAPLADILAAFLRPFLEVLAGTDEGWILYLRLIGRGMSNYARGGVHPALRQLAGIPDLLKEALRARYPLADEAAFHLASYMLEVALTHIVQDRGLLAARSEGQVEIARAIAHLDEISRYFAAGFAAIALRAES